MAKEPTTKHYLVTQLDFARAEFQRVMQDVSPQEGTRVLPPFNSLGFIVAHMAVHEHTMWILMGQQRKLYSGIGARFGSGAETSTPDWDEVWTIWHHVIQEADHYLVTLTDDMMDTFLTFRDQPREESLGHTLLRVINHYWFHIGEAHGLRQALGHTDIPDFVGDIQRTRYH